MSNVIDIKNKFIIFDSNKIDIIIDNKDVIWFNAKEICVILKYKNTRDAIITHVDIQDKIKLEKIKTHQIINKKKHPHTIYINESGLYSLLFSCRLDICKKFKNWITKDVIPSIRKFGLYELKKKYKNKLKNTIDILSDLRKEYDKIKNNLKQEKYPNGGMFYVLQTNKEGIYKIGITEKIDKRYNTYNTSIVDNANFLFRKKIDCPIQLEMCVKSLLYKYRYRDKREFYDCELKKIIEVVKKCINVLKDNKIKRNECNLMCTICELQASCCTNNDDCKNKQTGGYNDKSITYFIHKLNICKQLYIIKIHNYSKYMQKLNSII
jgi:prophage antirepressor-like protein